MWAVVARGVLLRWGWLLGAGATLSAALFVAMTLGSVQEASTAAGDLGELRAYAERIRSAGAVGEVDRLETLIEARDERLAGIRPVLRDLMGGGQADQALASLRRSFAELDAAALAGDVRAMTAPVGSVTDQVDLLLGSLVEEQRSTVSQVRWLAAAGIALTLLGTVMGLAGGAVVRRRMAQLAEGERVANQRSIASINPARSARGMNTPGDCIDGSAVGQRRRASTFARRPVR